MFRHQRQPVYASLDALVLFSVVLVVSASRAGTADYIYHIVNYPASQYDSNFGGTDTISGTIYTDGTFGDVSESHILAQSLTYTAANGVIYTFPPQAVSLAAAVNVTLTSTQVLCNVAMGDEMVLGALWNANPQFGAETASVTGNYNCANGPNSESWNMIVSLMNNNNEKTYPCFGCAPATVGSGFNIPYITQGSPGIASNEPWIIANGGAPLHPGDANGDGRVDINDLTIVLSNFGPHNEWTCWATGDFTGDGQVDVNDLTIVLANFDYGVGAAGIAAVPEPSCVVLLGIGAIGLPAFAWQRKRFGAR